MTARLATVSATLIAGAAAANASAATIDYDTDLTDGAGVTAIVGHATADDGTLGTLYIQQPQSNQYSEIIDGNSGSYVTTHQNGDNTFGYDFAGVTFATTQNNVAAVRLFHTTFSDGGWFANPGLSDSGTGDVPDIHPRIQVTTDGGASWAEVTGGSDDYDTVITSTSSGFANQRPAITFTFDAVSGINGVRVFGDGWGPAGNDTTGFIGVNEFQVFAVPEPASLALLALGGLTMLPRGRRQG